MTSNEIPMDGPGADGSGLAWTPLHRAARLDSPDMGSLIESSADSIDALDAEGNTPLGVALIQGSLRAALALSKAGASADLLASSRPLSRRLLRATPLSKAIELFGAMGAKQALPPEFPVGKGIAQAVDEAEERARQAGLQKPIAFELIKALLASGASPDQHCVYVDPRCSPKDDRLEPAWTALFKMPSLNPHRREPSECDALAVAELLAEHGWSPLSIAPEGQTALCFAASCGFGRVAELLLAKGWNPSAASSGETPDETARMHGHLELSAKLFRAREAWEIAASSRAAPSRPRAGRL